MPRIRVVPTTLSGLLTRSVQAIRCPGERVTVNPRRPGVSRSLEQRDSALPILGPVVEGGERLELATKPNAFVLELHSSETGHFF